MSRASLRSLLLAASLSFAAAAQAAAPSDAQVERLTDLVVTAMPFGKVFEMVQAGDPKWPLGDKAGQATPAQLACLRSELSSTGYRRTKRQHVQAYAAAHPERIADDIRLLEAGAAELFGKFVLAGAEGEASGQPADTDAIVAKASAAEGLALTSLATDESNADLRDLIGMGSMFDQMETDKGDAMKEKGEARGKQIGVQLMIGAMDTCKLPLSALQ